MFRLKPLRVAKSLDRAAAKFRFRAGRGSHRSIPGGFWAVAVDDLGDGRTSHRVTLSWGTPPRTELARLSWGVFPAAGGRRPIAAGRTDYLGRFKAADLPPGEYGVRYVAAIRDEQDVRVL